MKRIEPEAFLTIALRQGWVTAEVADDIRKQLERNPDLLVCEILRSSQGMDDDTFLRLLSAEVQTEYLPPEILAQMEIPREFVDRIGIDHLTESGVIPLVYDEAADKLLALSAYPFNPLVLRELPEFFGVTSVELAFSMESTVQRLMDELRKLAMESVGESSLIAAPGEEEGGTYLGAESEEDAFPGLYTQSFSETFYDEVESMGDEAKSGDSSGPHGVQGNLEDLGLLDMLQTLGQSRKTCTIKLMHERAEAYVFLDQGAVVHCLYGGRTGADAFYALMPWTKGYFDIQPGVYEGEPTITGSMDGLILEGLRRMDEEGR